MAEQFGPRDPGYDCPHIGEFLPIGSFPFAH